MASEGVRPRRVAATVAAGLGLLVVAFAFALGTGPTSVDWDRVMTFDRTWLDARKVWDHRLPRAIAAAITGAALALGGVVFQVLVRNPLASPYILGISAGGSLGAAIALAFGFAFAGPAAFLGCLAAVAVVFVAGNPRGALKSTSLLLAGVIVNATLSAAITFVNLVAAPSDRDRILRWLVGGFPEAFETSSLLAGAAVTVLLAAFMFLRSRELNLIAVSDGLAARSGVDVRRMRIEFFLTGSALTAAAVTLAGPIPFVGLVVPHVVRLVLGSDHRLTVPVSVFGGAAFVMVADALAASIWREPLPAGVLTAAIGGPMFLVMLRSADKEKAGLDD